MRKSFRVQSQVRIKTYKMTPVTPLLGALQYNGRTHKRKTLMAIVSIRNKMSIVIEIRGTNLFHSP